MTIGIDLTVLQSPHRLRGIGSTLINFLNNVSKDELNKNHFVFYVDARKKSPLDLINLEGFSYSVQSVRENKSVNLKLPGKLRLINAVLNQIVDFSSYLFGDKRVVKANKLDFYLQFDQNNPVPRKGTVKSVVVLYDLIPYVMSDDYLNSFKQALSSGKGLKAAVLASFHRFRYIFRLKMTLRKAYKLVAISDYTKKDFIKYAKAKKSKIEVVHLGVNEIKESKNDDVVLYRYKENSWGHNKVKVSLVETKFLLFVGGVDPRRKIIDLVAAFNNLRARGEDIKLVLAGDTMKSADSIPNIEIQDYLENTSYIDDVYFMGFVSDDQREWLYKNALAFVYPTVYEGFGLPVLEAMRYGTPVITYDSTSVKEIAEDKVLYAHDYETIVAAVNSIESMSPSTIKNFRSAGMKHAALYSWSTTSNKLLSSLR